MGQAQTLVVTAVLVRQIVSAVLLLLMQVAAVVAYWVVEQLGQVVQVVAVQVAAQPLVQQERRIRAAVAVAGVMFLAMAALVVQALSSSVTQAHKEAQAAQSHQAVATLFTHLRPLGLIQLNLIF
jgi:hypothetical protein